LATFSFCSIIFGLKSFFSSDILAFKNVNIYGNKEVSENFLKNTVRDIESESILGIIKRNNLLFFDKDKMIGLILGYSPSVKKIDIDFEGFETLNIELEERRPFVNWCFHSKTEECLIVDNEGYAFKKQEKTDFENNLPVIIDEFSTTTPKIKDSVPLNILEVISLKENIETTGWKVFKISFDKNTLNYILVGGQEIKVPLDFNLEKISERIYLIKDELLKSNASFKHIDLRFDNKAFIKK
jgi:hypothetical protein